MFRTTRGSHGILACLTVGLVLALSACGSSSSGSDPTRDQVKAGFEEIVLSGLGQIDYEIPENILDSYTDCLVDEAFDDLSSDGRQALASKNFEEAVSQADRQVVADASAACADVVGELATPAE